MVERASMNLRVVKNVKWYKALERDFDYLLDSYYAFGFQPRYFRGMGLPNTPLNRLTIFDGRVYYDQNTAEVLKSYFLKRASLAAVGTMLTRQFLRHARRYEVFLKKQKTAEYQNVSPHRLAGLYREFVDRVCACTPYSFLMSCLFEEVAWEAIAVSPVAISRESYGRLTSNERATATTQEYRERLRLALKLKSVRDSRSSDKKLRSHLARYAWLECYCPSDPPKSLGKLKQEVATLARRKEIESEVRALVRQSTAMRRQRTQMLKVLQLPAETLRLMTLMRENVWIRTYRRELFNYGFFVMRALHEEIARRMALSLEQLRSVGVWDIGAFLEHGRQVSLKTIYARQNGYAIIRLGGRFFTLTGADVPKIDPDKHRAQAQVKTISGTVAYPGRVSAPIQKVRNHSDLKHFKKGRILVAHTVATWMLPAVERCVGIVADAGGVLAHTAILAREFRKPCLVGTRIAMETLKDGDTVELDSTKGTVEVVSA